MPWSFREGEKKKRANPSLQKKKKEEEYKGITFKKLPESFCEGDNKILQETFRFYMRNSV